MLHVTAVSTQQNLVGQVTMYVVDITWLGTTEMATQHSLYVIRVK